jgi:hypothetical protein
MTAKKNIADDLGGVETLLPLFVMAATMLTTIIIISGGIGAMLVRNQPTAYWDQPQSWALIGDVEYAATDPTAGYNVTLYNHTQNPYTDNASRKFEFTYSDWEYLTVRLVRDCDTTKPFTASDEDAKYNDFVYIHAKADSGWFAGNRYLAMDYHGLTTRFVQQNISYAYFSMFKTNFTILISTATNNTNPADHINAVWAGNYNIKIAYNTEISDEARMSSSMWTILGQILTLQLPNINPVVNLLLAVPVWAAFGFMIFAIFRSVVPFLG